MSTKFESTQLIPEKFICINFIQIYTTAAQRSLYSHANCYNTFPERCFKSRSVLSLDKSMSKVSSSILRQDKVNKWWKRKMA